MSEDKATFPLADLEDFLEFAKRMGYVSMPTRTEYEAARIKKGHLQTLVYYTSKRSPNRIRPCPGDGTTLVTYWQGWKKSKESHA